MGLQCLIDADILVYEVGFAAEYGWQSVDEFGEKELPPFDYVADMLDARIARICFEVHATEPPLLFLTGKTNFRNDIAKRKPYKGTRKKTKRPWHYANIMHYLQVKYDATLAIGMEADDLLTIEQMSRLHLKDTIICSRDKDLRICPGLHYGWELGAQPAFGPLMVDDLGWIEKVMGVDAKTGKPKIKKIAGVGKKFFYAQCLMGDSVDNIPGLPRTYLKIIFELLHDLPDERSLFQGVYGLYKEKYAEKALQELTEQARLLWMVRELDHLGMPVMYEPKEEWLV